MKQLTIDLDKILKSEYGVNALGETLRAIFFNQSGGLGCYESFKLNEGVEQLPNEVEDEITYTCASWNGIKMRYYWDGDGYLEFILDEEERAIYNTDCKKDCNWDYEG